MKPPRTRTSAKSLPAADFRHAQARFAEWGVDVERSLKKLSRIRISLHCWQGDDVGGFEKARQALDGGLVATGSYPGKARTPDELRRDLEVALSLIPGTHRVNLHASYGEFGRQPADRNQIEPRHFKGWIQWASDHRLGLDFNPTFFSHPLVKDGCTLSHRDRGIREFWIEHGQRSRVIGAAMGRALGGSCVTNLWIPDGFKDTPAERGGARERLVESLDAVFKRQHPESQLLDSVEPKLFGIGAESCTVGSHEFYLSYALSRGKLLCLDTGHFHPTESVADKLSALSPFLPRLLLHVSRGVRWDSDHVVTQTDELTALGQELVRCGMLDRVHLGLDYFDASINRVAAWVIGSRVFLRTLLMALLEPWHALVEAERYGDLTRRLALQEEFKGLPYQFVWEEYCTRQGVPPREQWLDVVKDYERNVLVLRG